MNGFPKARWVGTPCPTRIVLLLSVFALLLVAALALSGCGGDGDEKRPVLTDDDLCQMVTITAEGLPWELEMVSDSASSDEDAAAEFPDPQQWLERYRDWGRAGGHLAQYQAGEEGVLSVEAEVEYYRSQNGAGPAFAAVREHVLSDDWAQYLKSRGLSDVRVEGVRTEEVGDGSVALRISVRLEQQTSQTFAVMFYRDGVLASASVGAQAEAASMDDALAVARLLDARVQEILESAGD